MIFFAQTDQRSYQMEVLETSSEWKITISSKTSEKKQTYLIPKKNYQQFGEVISFIFEQKSYLIDIVNQGTNYTIFTKGTSRTIQFLTEEHLFYNELSKDTNEKETIIQSEMPGQIVEIPVQKGEFIKEGDILIIIEAMKMENEIRAVKDGQVRYIRVKKGQSVEAGTALLSIK